jgi:hypothetical protein
MTKCLNCKQEVKYSYFCNLKCEVIYCEKMNEEQKELELSVNY